MKLKEKMFVRTKLNDFCNMVAIRKIDEFDDDGSFWIDDYIIDAYGDEQNKLNKEDIEKASENIIDVIEIGDYINGSKILSIEYAEDRYGNCDKLHYYYSFEDYDKDVNVYYVNLNIKSIVTKDQFVSMKYVVERDN